MSASARAVRRWQSAERDQLVIGAEPRVDLLPPEVRSGAAGRTIRRRMGFAVVGAVIVVAAASGGVFVLDGEAHARLLQEQEQTQSILAEQGRYSQVRTVQAQVSAVQAAQKVGGSTEIDWESMIDKAESGLPAGVTISNITVSSESPLQAFQQATAPLQGERIATITFSLLSPAVAPAAEYLDALQSLPGFVDASSGSVTSASSGFTIDITVHISESAFDGRYAKSGGQ